jgi:hypothetical protein
MQQLEKGQTFETAQQFTETVFIDLIYYLQRSAKAMTTTNIATLLWATMTRLMTRVVFCPWV